MENETKKEEILEKSREENKKGDEREKQAQNKAYAIGASIGLLLCMVVVLLERIVFDRSDDAVWLIYTGMDFPISLISYKETKKKSWLVLTILFGLCFVAYAALYIASCLGVGA